MMQSPVHRAESAEEPFGQSPAAPGVRFRHTVSASETNPPRVQSYARRCQLAATVWKGFISFGLVSFPVRLQVAAREKSIQFHLLHKKDLSRVKEVYFCRTEDKPLKREDLVRGYEVSKD